MGRGNFIAYVDECGDTGLEKFDPKNPVFVLCVALFKIDDYLGFDLPSLSRLKVKHWWHDAVVLHSYKIRSKVPPFQALHEPAKFDGLMSSLSQFFESCTATVIAAAIDKEAHKELYKEPENPYSLAMQFCLERVYGHTYPRNNSQNNETMFVFEKRGKKEDAALRAEFERISAGSNAWNKQFPFRICFAGKEENISGLQIADLIAYPIARFVESRNPNRKDYKSIQRLIRRGPRGIEGWGLKIFPK